MFFFVTIVVCCIGYILGLGDRHAKNMLISLDSGKSVAIDFGYRLVFKYCSLIWEAEITGTYTQFQFRLQILFGHPRNVAVSANTANSRTDVPISVSRIVQGNNG